jgi:uncharacterized protein DUF1206
MTSTEIGKLSRKARGASNSPWVNALARIGLAAKGASFVIVGVLAGKLAVGAGGTATSREGALNRLAREPFGETLLIALACGFAAYALWRFAQAFFDKENEGEGPKGLAKRATYFGRGNTAELSRTARDWVGRIGTIGMLARMVVFGLIGWFLVKAAVEYDAKDAIGLDGALQKLAHQTYGSWLLGVVAVGLVAYGIYGLVEARYRRV